MTTAPPRDVRPDDCAGVLALVKELARYEKAEGSVKMTEEDLRHALFAPVARLHGLVVDGEAGAVAMALFFFSFSTWTGRPGLFLEDLYVQPAHRRQGTGRALLRELAARALELGCSRFEWEVLDWNEPAIKFYRSLGAEPQDEWTRYRVVGRALEDLALPFGDR